MSKSEDAQYELNRVESMMAAVDINSPVIPIPRLAENYRLDKLMARIRLQPGGLEAVITIMDKIEIDFPKYRDSLWYKLLIPGPVELIKTIHQRFSSNYLAEGLFEYLYNDESEITRCRRIYKTNIIFSILVIVNTFTLLVVIVLQPYWIKFTCWILFFLLLILTAGIFIQIYWFAQTMKYICFTKIYTQMMDVLQSHYNQHCAYVKRVIEIPQQIEERWQETERQMILDGISDVEIRNRKSLELETGQRLQQLASVIAVNQATTDANIQKIKNGTRLNYLERELNIHDEIDSKKRRHELFRSSVDAMGQFLVERGKALSEDEQEQRNIKYQLHLLKGIRNGDVSDESVYDSINQIMNMMTNSKSANDVYE